MKNRIVALALALVMVLSVAVASAATIPGNVKDIADLPAVPTVPTFKVKANDHTATITLSQEVDYVNAWWAWAPTAVEMNGTTGTYRVDSHKFQVGMGTWGSLSKTQFEGAVISPDHSGGNLEGIDPEGEDETKNEKGKYVVPYDVRTIRVATEDEYKAFHDGRRDSKFTDWGMKYYTYVWKQGKDADGNDMYWAQDMTGYFGTYEMGFAYDLEYTDADGNKVYVRYDRFGNPVEISLSVFGGYDPFVGENPASCTKITWNVVLRGSKYVQKRVWIVKDIKVTYDEGDVASITGVYFNGKRQYTGKLVDYAVESR
jgi:hypothetical protein